MKITTQQEAEAAVEAVVEWLRNHRTLEGMPSWYPRDRGEDNSAWLARCWSLNMLEASTAYGRGGCLLCRN